MKLLFILIFFAAFISCNRSISSTVDQIKKDVAYLASDSLEGRFTGSEGERKAAAYIVKRFEALNLQPKGDENTYFQKFIFNPENVNPHQSSSLTAPKIDSIITGTNVIGYIDNDEETTIVIGAHYDHLGYGTNNSLYRGVPAIHNGADDNASGVSLLMDLALKLKGENRDNNYLFIAFSGEELGLLGSNYFVENPTIPLKDINYMINLDMVGRLDKKKRLMISGTGTSPIWEEKLSEMDEEGYFKLIMKPSGIGASDHTSFYLKDIPVLHFFTGQHRDYHKPSDDYQLLNYKDTERISNYIFKLISALDDERRLTFTKTKQVPSNIPDFKVTLGIVPDYMYDGRGVRIDGVTDDRPADKAGLIEGDIVLRLEDDEILDVLDYMKALAKFEKGQTIKVIVSRKRDSVTTDLTFQ